MYLLGFVINFVFSWIPPVKFVAGVVVEFWLRASNFLKKIYFNAWSSNILTTMPAFSLMITVGLVDFVDFPIIPALIAS